MVVVRAGGRVRQCCLWQMPPVGSTHRPRWPAVRYLFVLLALRRSLVVGRPGSSKVPRRVLVVAQARRMKCAGAADRTLRLVRATLTSAR